MSKISEEYLRIINDIEKNISNEEERKYVAKKVSELSSLYMDIVEKLTDTTTKRIDELEQYHNDLERRLSKVGELVNLIKKDIYEDDEFDFEIVCPYCNYEFVADVEDELREEIECPECHNIIELDWDGEDDGCDCCCSSCGCCDDEDHNECDCGNQNGDGECDCDDDCDCGCKDKYEDDDM